MAYENIAFFRGDEAEPLLHRLEEDGPFELIADLKCYHCPGQHPVVSADKLNIFPDDDSAHDGHYFAWWNTTDGYVGFAHRLTH